MTKNAVVESVALVKQEKLQDRVARLIGELEQVYLEREDLIRLMLTAYISKQNLFVGGAPGCQPKESKVLMANGEWANVADVKVGDYILSPQHDGTVQPKRVIDTFIYDDYPVYRVAVNNRNEQRSYLCSGNHILPHLALKIGARPQRARYTMLQECSVEQYLTKVPTYQKKSRIFTTPAYDLPEQNFEIHPYVMGCLLGNGCVTSGTPSFYSSHAVVFERLKSLGVTFGCKRWNNGHWAASIVGNYAKLIKDSSIYGHNAHTKEIPSVYLRGSLQQRLELLAGLIDTDGTFEDYSSVSKTLINGFQHLIMSIGGYCTTRLVTTYCNKKPFDSWRAFYSVGEYSIPVSCIYKKNKPRNFEWKNYRNKAFSIEYLKRDTVYGFELESSSQWYITDGFLVTHNTAKTSLSKAIARIFNTSTFYYLVSPTTQVEEVLGPVNLKALQAGEFERDLTGRLADTNLAIMDEIFKSSSPLLNTLLGLILDREIVNGKKLVKAPLVSLVGCSNELPEDDALAPFWDRFVLRYWVDEVSAKNRLALLYRQSELAPVPTVTEQFTPDELTQMQFESAQLFIDRDCLKLLNKIVNQVEGISISTRRLMQTIDILKAWAYVHGDLEVTEDHLNLLYHTLWSDLEQRKELKNKLKPHLNSFSETVNAILKSAQKIYGNVQDFNGDTLTKKAKLAATDSKLLEMFQNLERLPKKRSAQRDIADKAIKIISKYRENVVRQLSQLDLEEF